MEQEYLDTPEGRAEMKRQLEAWGINAQQMADEQDLPPHKRSGYAESMAEQADMRRKAEREQF